ncbi:MAG: beta-N-acetylhexosaminidase [Rhodoferax sp.]|nr:beta-N-acetylhexosaminidase [Rhodoferax sp.]
MIQPSPLIIDVAGLRLSGSDAARLSDPLVGGVVLFGRNWQDRAQLAVLCAQIKAIRQDLLILVDHEGGRVQRFRSDGFTHIPPMRALGQCWSLGVPGDARASALRASSAATACGFVLGSELRACGVDLSFTPVLDLDYGASGVIGDRAFAADAAVVSLLAKGLMHGMLRSGMANCGKHFPGHGFVRADSHTEVPVDRRSLRQILAADAAPYGWLDTSLASVMPAHVVYPKVDSRPAGFSKRWLEQVLRGTLRFRGAVFSDDLSMAGARQIDGRTVSYAQAAVAALDAGCDMVLLCNQSVGDGAAVDGLLDGLRQARSRGEWLPRAASEQRRLDLLPIQPGPDWDNLMVDSHYMQALDLIP